MFITLDIALKIRLCQIREDERSVFDVQARRPMVADTNS